MLQSVCKRFETERGPFVLVQGCVQASEHFVFCSQQQTVHSLNGDRLANGHVHLPVLPLSPIVYKVPFALWKRLWAPPFFVWYHLTKQTFASNSRSVEQTEQTRAIRGVLEDIADTWPFAKRSSLSDWTVCYCIQKAKRLLVWTQPRFATGPGGGGGGGGPPA